MRKNFNFLILLFFIISNIFIFLKSEEGRTASIAEIKSELIAPVSLSLSWKDRQGGDAIRTYFQDYSPAVDKKSIEPLKEYKISERSTSVCTGFQIPESYTYGTLDQKKVTFTGVGTITEDLQLTAGQTLDLVIPLEGTPIGMNGKAIALLTKVIGQSKTYVFQAMSEDEVQVCFLENIKSPEYSLKVIFGQNESKIVTKKEEEILKEKNLLDIDPDRDIYIRANDQVVFETNFDGTRLLRRQARDRLTAEGNNRNSESIFTLSFTDDNSLVENAGLYFLKLSDNRFVRTEASGVLNFSDNWGKQEKFRIEKVGDTNKPYLKDGDKVRIVSYHGQVIYPDRNGWYWEKYIMGSRIISAENDFVWNISLVNKKTHGSIKLPDYPKITKAQNENAVMKAGQYNFYWVSKTDKYIYAGYGVVPGMNITLFRVIPEEYKNKINYIGWSSNKRAASIKNIMMFSGLNLTDAYNEYGSDLVLKSKYYGALNFKGQIKENIIVNFFALPNGQDLKYQINISQNNITLLKKIKDKLAVIAKSGEIKNFPLISDKNLIDYKISINSGYFVIEVNNTIVLVYKDDFDEKGYQYISFSNNFKPVDLNITSPRKIDLESVVQNYENEIKSYEQEENRPFKILMPFEYDLRQIKLQVACIEKLYTNKESKVLALEKGGETNYDVIVKFNPTGIPEFNTKQDPQLTAGEQAMKIAAAGLSTSGQATQQIGGWYQGPIEEKSVRTGGYVASEFTAEGKPTTYVEQTAAKRSLSGMAVTRGVGALMSTAGSVLQDLNNYDLLRTTGIYSDSLNLKNLSSSEEIIQTSNDAIEKYFDDYNYLKLDDENELSRALDLMINIVNSINSTDNINIQRRDLILQAIDKISSRIDSFSVDTYYDYLQLLIGVIENKYILPADQYEGNRKEIIQKINDAYKTLFSALQEGKIDELEVYSFSGEAIYTGLTLPEEGEGTFYVSAKGISDLIMILNKDESNIKNLNRPIDIYMGCFGADSNKMTGLSLNSLGQLEKSVLGINNPNAVMQQLDFKGYYISVSNKNKTIELGVVIDDKPEKILSVKDPYPEKVLNTALSSWNNPITINKIAVGKNIEEILKNIKEQEKSKEESVVEESTEVTNNNMENQ